MRKLRTLCARRSPFPVPPFPRSPFALFGVFPPFARCAASASCVTFVFVPVAPFCQRAHTHSLFRLGVWHRRLVSLFGVLHPGFGVLGSWFLVLGFKFDVAGSPFGGWSSRAGDGSLAVGVWSSGLAVRGLGVGRWPLEFGPGVVVSSLLLPLAYVAVPKGRAHTSPRRRHACLRMNGQRTIACSTMPTHLCIPCLHSPFVSIPLRVLSRQPCSSRPLLSLHRSSLVHGHVFLCAVSSSSWLFDALVSQFPSFRVFLRFLPFAFESAFICVCFISRLVPIHASAVRGRRGRLRHIR